jgi:site-specific DNA-methyltransferase (adenine-specific)
MRTEALEAGFYHSDLMQRDYPRIQILTIGELLRGKDPAMPPTYSPYRLAEHQRRDSRQPSLFERTGSE